MDFQQFNGQHWSRTIPETYAAFAKSDADCSLIGIYAKKRMLSGPWSASRRLKAARIRGDEDEAKRMEAMLDDFVGKAIFEEEP